MTPTMRDFFVEIVFGELLSRIDCVIGKIVCCFTRSRSDALLQHHICGVVTNGRGCEVKQK